jgi:signal transduction histidine kinase
MSERMDAAAALSPELATVLRDYMDVTDRLQRTHETLQREVERLRHELASKDQELERRRRLAALGELAAGVAHEVRNPLGAIQLYSGLLRSACADQGQALDLINKIEAGIQAIDRVVQDTLALTPRSGRLAQRPIAEVLAAAVESSRAALQQAGVTVRIRQSEPDLAVTADGSLVRVFVNLIVNAAQASPPGSEIEVLVGRRERRVVVRVRDEGPGLPPELWDRVFDPFFTTKEQGTGLGLTIAHRLVEAHGGTISARNRARTGAEFTVALPMGDRTGHELHVGVA